MGVDRGDLRVQDFVAELGRQGRLHTVEPAEWNRFDSGASLFKNMNAPRGLRRSPAILQRRCRHKRQTVTEPTQQHYFEFKNVSKSFGENDVLKDVSFFVNQGETAVIMGRSGVGQIRFAEDAARF